MSGKQKLTVRLRDVENGKFKVPALQPAVPGEYRRGQSVPPVLAAALVFAPEDVKANITPVETRRSVEPWCYFMALSCALGSVVLRRV